MCSKCFFNICTNLNVGDLSDRLDVKHNKYSENAFSIEDIITFPIDWTDLLFSDLGCSFSFKYFVCFMLIRQFF